MEDKLPLICFTEDFTGNVTLAELLQYYNYGLANAFSTEISKRIDISVENAYNLFVDMEH